MLVVVCRVAGVQELQEDGLQEDFNHVFEILAEVGEEAEEDRDDEGDSDGEDAMEL